MSHIFITKGTSHHFYKFEDKARAQFVRSFSFTFSSSFFFSFLNMKCSTFLILSTTLILSPLLIQLSSSAENCSLDYSDGTSSIQSDGEPSKVGGARGQGRRSSGKEYFGKVILPIAVYRNKYFNA